MAAPDSALTLSEDITHSPPSLLSPLLPSLSPSPPSHPPLPTLEYRGRVFLAPMVRVCSLPFRLLCRFYGADVCFSEEIIDRSISSCVRRYNSHLDSVDFVRGDKVVFRTCAADHPNIFQIGTADPVFALRGAEVVCRDVDGIDINMGCPKHFSISGGMGAALLSNPEKVFSILLFQFFPPFFSNSLKYRSETS